MELDILAVFKITQIAIIKIIVLFNAKYSSAPYHLCCTDFTEETYSFHQCSGYTKVFLNDFYFPSFHYSSKDKLMLH